MARNQKPISTPSQRYLNAKLKIVGCSRGRKK